MGSADRKFSQPLVDDIAKVEYGTTLGEVDRYDMQRVVGLTANIHGQPLGEVAQEVRAAIAQCRRAQGAVARGGA